MKYSRRTTRSTPLFAASALTLALALAGCGGGGGGTDDAAPASITADNSVLVASHAYGAADVLYLHGAGATGVLDEKSSDTASTATMTGLSGFILHQLLRRDASARDGTPHARKALDTEAQPCDSGGYLVAAWNDADASDTLSTGDSGSITFFDCAEDAGLQRTGKVTFSDLRVTGTEATPARTIGLHVSFEDFRMSTGSTTATIDGDMAMQAAMSSQEPYTYDLSLSGNRLVVRDDARKRTLSSYEAEVLIDQTAETYAYDVAGTISGTGLPGTILMTTPQRLSGTIGSHPARGTLVATAADGTSVRLVAVSADTVAIELDADADGEFESHHEMDWSELEAP